jgi:hypothetical protein
MSKCIALDCDKELEGRQAKFCSHRCKQAEKYAVKTGRQCRACHKPMKPKPVLGGYAEYCERKACIKKRGGT